MVSLRFSRRLNLTKKNMTRSRFEVLDSFRGLFAIFVVIHHMRVTNSITETNFFLNAGYFVEFFFILSGFVMTHGYDKSRLISFKEYIVSRVFRLWPLHIFTLAIVMCIEFAKFVAYHRYNFEFNTVPFTGRYSLSELLPNIFLVHSITSYTNNTSFNFASWSISVELFLYIMFYFTLKMHGLIKHLVWFIVSISFISFLIFDYNVLVPNLMRGLSCFFLGAIIYWIITKIIDVEMNMKAATILELLSLAFVVLVISAESTNRLVTITVFSIMLIIYSYGTGYISKILKWNIFISLGKLSYSIYLLHVSVIFCLTSVLYMIEKYIGGDYIDIVNGVLMMNTGSTTMNNIVIITTVALVVFLSRFTYGYIELPGIRFGKKIIGKSNDSRT